MCLLIGQHTGHHILLDISTGDSVRLDIITDTATTFTDRWSFIPILNIKTFELKGLENQSDTDSVWPQHVRLLPVPHWQSRCDLIHAPNYVSNSSGMITSFNFWNTDTTRQLHLGKIKFPTKSDLIDIFNSNISAAMDYTICLRRETGHCCLLCDKEKMGKVWKLKNTFFQAPRHPLPRWLGHERGGVHHWL